MIRYARLLAGGASLIALACGAGGARAQAAPSSATPPGPAPIAADSPTSAAPPPAAARSELLAPVPVAPTAGGASGDEVVVTANRREEALSRVGVTANVVTAAQLSNQEVHQPLDLARVVPAFQATTAGLSGSPVFILRGIGFDTPNPTATAPVGTYVDEVAYAYPYMLLGEVFDLERAEVLKGPQGTLYGRNSTGGLVDLISAKPTAQPHAGFTIGYGSYSSLLAEGYVSGPITSTLKGRLAFQSDNRFDGWQYSVTRPNDRLGQRYQESVRGSLQWDPTDRLSVFVSGTYWHLGGEPQAPQAVAYVGNPATANPLTLASIITNPSNDRQADWTPASRQPQSNLTNIIRPFYSQDSEFSSGTIKASYRLTDRISLASLTNYSHLSFNTVSEVNGAQTESQTAVSTGRIGSFSQELRLIGDMGRLQWSAGGYYALDRTHEYDFGFVDELSTIVGLRTAALGLDRLLGNPVPAVRLQTSFRNYSGLGDYVDRVAAGFANIEYKLTDKLKLSAGGRYTDDNIHGSGCGQDVNGNNVALVNFLYPVLTKNPSLAGIQPNGCYTLTADNSRFALAQQGQDQDNFSWRVRGDYTPSDTVLFYASVSRGYKSGEFPVLAASNATQLLPVTQEKLTAFEVGTKLRLLERRVQLNLSGYFYDYDNRQIFGRIPDLIFGTLQRIVNIPRSEVYGLEADGTWRITDTLRFEGSASYLHTEVKRFTGYNNALVAALVDFKGSDLPYSPHFQTNLALTNDMPIFGGDMKLYTSVFGSYQSSSSSALGNQAGYGIKAYGLMGLKAGVHAADDRWNVSLYVTNLTDEYYWTSVQRQSETLLRYTGMPRMIGFRASYQY